MLWKPHITLRKKIKYLTDLTIIIHTNTSNTSLKHIFEIHNSVTIGIKFSDQIATKGFKIKKNSIIMVCSSSFINVINNYKVFILIRSSEIIIKITCI